MSDPIICHEEAYNLYSTEKEMPFFPFGINLAGLQAYIGDSRGAEALALLNQQLVSIGETGTSIPDSSLEETIRGNRAGDGGVNLPLAEFIQDYLTIVSRAEAERILAEQIQEPPKQ